MAVAVEVAKSQHRHGELTLDSTVQVRVCVSVCVCVGGGAIDSVGRSTCARGTDRLARNDGRRVPPRHGRHAGCVAAAAVEGAHWLVRGVCCD